MFSVCIITRNEEAKLDQCLSSLKSYPVEIIVVDTGSTDQSVSIAKKYTEHVYQFQWEDDFSKARNFAASKAHEPWIITIDTDETVTSFDYECAVRMVQEHSGQVGRFALINIMDRASDLIHLKEHINRIYQKDRYCYTGRIHEQITGHDGSEQDQETFLFPMTVLHSGYQGTKQQIEEKANRNIALLLKYQSDIEKLDKEDPYIIYQLGKSYFMKHDYHNALEYFEKATTFDLNPKLEYVLDMIIAYGYSLLGIKAYEQALGFAGIYEEFCYSADFQFLMGLIYMNNAEFQNAVDEFTKAAQNENYMVEGVNSYMAFYNIGVIYECLGKKEKAVLMYQNCGHYKKALERLNVLKVGE